MEENLRRINPYVKVSAHRALLDETNIPGIFCGVGALVEAFDGAESKAMLINTMASACPGVPVVASSGVAGHGPSNSIKTTLFSGNYYIVGDQETEAAAGVGLMAPRVGIAAHHQANCVLRLLLGVTGE
jgi:sulfur carrier protein ThiS adenylyltransferase